MNRSVWAGLVVILALLALACMPRTRTLRFVLPTTIHSGDVAVGRASPTANNCVDWQGYVPDPRYPDHLPVRLLRVNVHVLDNRAGNAHRPKDSVLVFVRDLLQLANAALDTNEYSWRSPSGTPVLPKRYRYMLTPQPDSPGDEGIYFHYDDDLYYFVSMGKNQNNYTRHVVDRYGIGTDSIINIFLLTHHPDSMRSPTYRANGQGIALGTALKMAGVLESQEGPSSFDGLLNHEVGHILGLNHAWSYDGCDDTNDHPNKCWSWTTDPPCNEQATNNMMDYNAYQIALSPCQIGKVQATFANEKNTVRRCLLPTWCTLRPDRKIVVTDSVVWAGARDLEGDLTIAAGGNLRVSCRVSMPPGAKITVNPGGVLWLDGCRLHNACGKTWQGIFVEEKNGIRGEVRLMRQPVLDNLE
ncbi:MAG: reprolysin-like metallopeptidase [Saprospiraceae bacterium]